MYKQKRFVQLTQFMYKQKRFIQLTQFMYKQKRFIQFSLNNMFLPFRLLLGKLYYINILISCWFSSALVSIYNFRKGEVIYSVLAGCNSYTSLNISFFILNFLFLQFMYVFQFYYTRKQISHKWGPCSTNQKSNATHVDLTALTAEPLIMKICADIYTSEVLCASVLKKYSVRVF
jgi:hypothetical protein